MAKSIIVDENDNPIDRKDWRAIDPKDDIVRISVLWLENSKNQVLLAQRKFNKKYNPGKWGPAVGGTVEEGETYESNIYKEAQEEIGLTDRTFKTGPKVFNTEPNRKFCQIYTLTADIPIESLRIQEEEVEAIKWVDKDELKKELENNPDDYTPTVHMMLKE